MLTPIALFVYNRPDCTHKTVAALENNVLAEASDLFVYSDGPKNENDIAGVSETRSFIKSLDGFKSITIIERTKNLGLAENIISGVTESLQRCGKIIVMEDDLVTSPYFLTFMNDALNYYENEKWVWHISGWNYPIQPDNIGDAFLWRLMSCHGWGTWNDRWVYFEKDVDTLIAEFNKEDKKKFDLDGDYGFWKQVMDNKNGRINTWAVFWYASIFRHGGLCLNPTIGYVNNIGFDKSATHTKVKPPLFANDITKAKQHIDFSSIPLEENKEALARIQAAYKESDALYKKQIVAGLRNNILSISGVSERKAYVDI